MPTNDESLRVAPQPISFIQTSDFQKGIKALKKKYPSVIDDLDRLLIILEQMPQPASH